MVHPLNVKERSFNDLLQAAGAEERRRIGFGAAELTEEGHRLFGTALLEEGLAEGLRRGGVEDTVGHELLPGIHIQDFSPQIAVIACAVAAVEDVVEIGRAVARDDLVDEAHLGADLR